MSKCVKSTIIKTIIHIAYNRYFPPQMLAKGNFNQFIVNNLSIDNNFIIILENLLTHQKLLINSVQSCNT